MYQSHGAMNLETTLREPGPSREEAAHRLRVAGICGESGRAIDERARGFAKTWK